MLIVSVVEQRLSTSADKPAVAPGGTTAPPRAVPRNSAASNGEEKAWIQEVVAQTIESSHMKRYGLLREMSAAILFWHPTPRPTSPAPCCRSVAATRVDAASSCAQSPLPSQSGSVPRKKDNPACRLTSSNAELVSVCRRADREIRLQAGDGRRGASSAWSSNGLVPEASTQCRT